LYKLSKGKKGPALPLSRRPCFYTDFRWPFATLGEIDFKNDIDGIPTKKPITDLQDIVRRNCTSKGDLQLHVLVDREPRVILECNPVQKCFSVTGTHRSEMLFKGKFCTTDYLVYIEFRGG
jgi:hypothetical protein